MVMPCYIYIVHALMATLTVALECLQKHDMFIMLKLILSHAPEALVLECEVFGVYATKHSLQTCSKCYSVTVMVL